MTYRPEAISSQYTANLEDEIDRLRLERNQLDAQVRKLRKLLREAIEVLEIYYIPNSDGSTPTITRARAGLEEKK